MGSHEERLRRAHQVATTRPSAPPPPEQPVNIIDFAVRMLGLTLYPLQGTVLKIVTLAVEALTPFDHQVIREFGAGFLPVADGEGLRWSGDQGSAPDVLDRMATLRARGNLWFNEIVLVLGRRAGKGYLVRILVAWAIWQMICDDPHAKLGIDPNKELNLLVFSTKAETAKRDQFADIRSLLATAARFEPWVGKQSGSWVSILTPAQVANGARPGIDKGLIVVRPRRPPPLRPAAPPFRCWYWTRSATSKERGQPRTATASGDRRRRGSPSSGHDD
jgi:hypothetical protein